MEFRKAYLAALLAVTVVAGCSTSPSSKTRVYETPVVAAPDGLTETPPALTAARSQLASMDADERIASTLSWASSYLNEKQAADASQLLSDLNPEKLNSEQRFAWLLLSGRAQLSQQQTEKTLSLLQQHQEEILQYPAEQQAQLDLLRADALAMKGELLSSLQQRIAAHPLLGDEDQDYNLSLIHI